jgi:hypothetical protein
MRRSCIVAGVLLFGLASCAGQSEYLSATELTQVVVGHQFSSTNNQGVAYTIKFIPGGTGTLTYSGISHPLAWVINGDVICFGAAVSGQSQTECDRVRSAGGEYDFVNSATGNLSNTYTPF